MASVIDALVITLGLDPKGVKQGMAEAEKTVGGGMSKITNVIKSFAAPIAGAFAAGKLFSDWLSGADALGKFSAQMGQNIEDMGAWREAIIRAGGTAEGFASSFEGLNSRIAMAATVGTGRGRKIFESLGVALKDADGKVRDTKDVLLDLADVAQKMDRMQFVGLARMLGLDNGMIRALQQGRGALLEQIKYQKELGVYTEADAKATADFNDRMADFKQALRAASGSVFRIFVPALTEALRLINKGMIFLRKHEKAVQAFFIILAGAVTAYALPALAKLAAAAATNPFTLMIAGAAALAIALEDLYVWATGGKAAFGDFWSQFGTPEEVLAGLQKLWDMLKDAGRAALDFGGYVAGLVKEFWPLLAAVGAFAATVKVLTMLETAFAAIKTAILGVKGAMAMLNIVMAANPIGAVIVAIAAAIAISYLLIKNWDKVKEVALKVWGAVADFIAGVWEKVKGAAQTVWSAVADFISGAWERVKALFSGAAEWFSSIFAAVADAIIAPFRTAFDWIANKWQAVKSFLGAGAEIDAGAAGGKVRAGGGSRGGTPVIMAANGNAGQSLRPSVVNNSRGGDTHRNTQVSVGKVEVHTQATDAQGIARDIGGGLQRDLTARTSANQTDAGVIQ